MGYVADMKKDIERMQKMIDTKQNGIGDPLTEKDFEDFRNYIATLEKRIAKYMLVRMPYRVYKKGFEDFRWEKGEYDKETKTIELYIPKEDIDEKYTTAEMLEADLAKL